jgi:outer membrane protein OmpA-like peptidoglycan-associated protein
MTSGETLVQERRTIRRLRRKDGNALPFAWFFPWGPLAGLGALILFGWGPFAFASVQHDTEVAARQALADIGATWAIPRVDGQWVEIDGEAPSKDAADQAVAAVRRQKVMTLFGEAIPVRRVTRRIPGLTEPTPTLDPAPVPAEPAPAPLPQDPAATPPVFEPAAPSPAPITPTLTTPATPPPPPATCQQVMADLLGRSRIEFATASAAIGPDSASLLDELAKSLSTCPGGFRIEGHTDSAGSSDRNAALSQRRAQAVRAALIERGVLADRLLAQGFGDAQPLGDNATDDGRARNRRIEIKIIPPT